MRWESLLIRGWRNWEQNGCTNSELETTMESKPNLPIYDRSTPAKYYLFYSRYLLVNYSLEEDFMLWRESFWPAVCDFFDVHTLCEDINTRQYSLKVHGDELEP